MPELLDIPFVGGLEQSVASQALPLGKMLAVSNGRIDKSGRISKRYGTSGNLANLTGSGLGADTRLCSYRDELVVVNAGYVFTLDSHGAAGLVQKGNASECVASRSSFTSSAIGVYNPDCTYLAIGTGYLVFVWDNGGAGGGSQTLCTIIDVVTGAEVVSAQLVASNGGLPRVCALSVLGSQAAFIVYETATGALKCVKVTQSGGGAWTFAAPTTLVASIAGGFEVAAMSDRFVVAYCDSITHPCVHLKSYDISLSNLATGASSNTVDSAYVFMGLRATTGERVWLTYRCTSAGTYQVTAEWFDPATLASGGAPTILYSSLTTADTPVSTAIERIDSTTTAFVYTLRTFRSNGGIGYSGSVVRADVYTNAGSHTILGSTRETGFSRLASKPFAVSLPDSTTRIYAWAYVGGACIDTTLNANSQFSLVLMDLWLHNPNDTRAGRPVAVSAPRFASPKDPTAVGEFAPASVVTIASGALGPKLVTAARVKKSAGGRTGLAKLTTDFGDVSRWAPGELGDTLHLSGGMPALYSGGAVNEIGYTYHPEGCKLLPSASTGSMGVGSYSYVLVFEQPDGRGQISRSIVSAPVTTSLAGGQNTVTILAPNYCVTSRYGDTGANTNAPVAIVPYRTLSTTPSGPYYRVFPESTPTSPGATTPETYALTDTFADGTIATHPHVYTEGNVEANCGPPCFLHLAVHKGRLWGIAEDGRTLWYSKSFVEGEAVSFVDDFTIFLEDSSGQATGLASMDDKLVIFTKSRVYYLYGEGPTDAFAQLDYPAPIRVVSPVGCIDARSIVVTPAGVFFQSAVGIHLLTRGLEVQFIGQSVQDTLAAYPKVRSAILHPSLPLIYFVLGDADPPAASVRLVFDYRLGEWTTDTITFAGVTSLTSQAVRAGSELYFVATGGSSLYREDPTTYLDGGQWVTLSVQTAHARRAGMQGEQVVHLVTLLAERFTPHDISISVQGNYLGAPLETAPFSDTVIAAQPFLPVEQLQRSVKLQKTTSLVVTVSDAAPTGGASRGTGRGAAFLGVTLELDMSQGTYRLPAAQKG